MMSNDSHSRRRMPAEWEPVQGVLLSWPHKDTDWAYMLDEVSECFARIAGAIVESGAWLVVVAPDLEVPKRWLRDLDSKRILYCQVLTNDTWARDFGPITVEREGEKMICDFKFNGWGLKFPACYDNLITAKLSDAGLFSCLRENHLGFVLEGGSIESDGNGTILTTTECLLSPNRNGNLTREEIERYLCRALGAERVLWIGHGYLAGDDTDSHVDTLARLAPNDTILYVKCDDTSDEHYEELRAMENDLQGLLTSDGLPYHLVGLPMPDAVFDENGERLPATYANFLILNDTILMPTYNQHKNDFLAAQILKIAFPEHEVKGIDCRALIRQHGSLHCVTMQLPCGVLPV